MGSESYSSDFHTETAVKLRMPSSFACDDYANVFSSMMSKGLEDREESRSNALELAKIVEAQEISFKEGHKIVEAEALRVGLCEEQDDFPELSLLRGDCVLSSSDAGIGAEVDYMSRIFKDGIDCNACEGSFLVSLRLDVDGPSMDVEGAVAKEVDGFCRPLLPGECTITSVISNDNSVEGGKGNLSNVQAYKPNFDIRNDNVTNFDDKSKNDSQLFAIENDLGLPLQSSGKLKETCLNNFASSCEIDTSHQKVEEEILGVQHIDREASCSAQGSTGDPTFCFTVEGSTFEKLSSVEFGIRGSQFDSFKRTSTCCSTDNDCCIEEEILPGVSSSLTSVRRTNPKRAASLRSNLSDDKSIPPIRIQSNRRKYRRKFGSSTSCTPMTLKMFSGVNRKVRSSHRKSRLSEWGTVESLFTIIKQRDELIKDDSIPNTIRRRRSKKEGRGIKGRKKMSALKNKHSRVFSTEIPLSCQPIHPRTSRTNIELEKNLAKKWNAVVKSNTREGQLEEKDLESTLTQETSSDNLLSECHGVSSRANLDFPLEAVDDPGNSPNSDVYNPIADVGSLTFDGSTITKRGFNSKKKSQIQNSKEEDGLTSIAPDFIDPFVAHLPLLTGQMHAYENQRRIPMIGHKGKKKMKEKKKEKGKMGKLEDMGKSEKIGKKTGVHENSFLISHPSPGEVDCQGKSNELKKTSLSSSCSLNCQETCKGGKCSKVSRKLCKIKSSSEQLPIDSSVSGLADLNKFTHCMKIQKRTEINNFPLQNGCSEQLEEILPSGYVKECQVRESTKEKLHRNKTNLANSMRHTTEFIHGHQKENILKSDKLKEDYVLPNINDNLGFSLGTTNNVSQLEGEIVAVDALLKDATNDVATPVFSESTTETYNIFSEQSSFSGKKAWALCDDCQKWRCVPDELVHVIEKGKWTCKDNVDEAFADCTIPQEKTDEDINNDLGISNEQYCSTTLPNGELVPPRLPAAARTTWTPIKSNLFLHRNRRTQTIDEIMVCHCKLPQDGGLGCGEECLNRMLNIECVKGTCPCGNLCSNQLFQKHKYAKFKWLKCGKKGYGLQLEHNVSRGQFLIEYVGEVLDLAAYEARLRYYACRGQKHFYFMTLNGGEVIDACDKGNLGRFINHSCDPNCRTEKWMVNGEVCIGLFALRDIKKGEEITFDYNYVRVFGAAAKKCVCGAADCRGYIGGDPSSSEVIVQDDSDTEDLEPVMAEGGENELSVMGIDSVAANAKVANNDIFSVERNDTHGNSTMSVQGTRVEDHIFENQDAIHQLSSELDLPDSLIQSSCVESEVQPFQEVKLGLNSIEPDQIFYEGTDEGASLSPVYRSLPHGQFSGSPEHSLNTGLQTNVSSQSSCSFMHRSSETGLTKEILTASKPSSVVKTVRHIKVKRSKVSIKGVASGKTKKVSTAISSRHIEGVEEKLNELLDEDGGIFRKKDAAKGYLKLLVVTAAAGDETKGSMSQSARDLSLILDAILKTKSRMVLVDIINKNGLQMLHNMMKQNRDNFNRIPILRKLLKVLEFLAEKEILTVVHIYAPPPRSGMESFRESMLKLMKHRDAQVHNIARNFADQWIPRNFHRVEPPDRDGRQLSSNYSLFNWCQSSNLNSQHDHDKLSSANCQPSSEVDIHREAPSLPTQAASSSASFTDIAPIERAKSRKRKSEWVQPSDINEQALEFSAMRPPQLEPISDIEDPKQKSLILGEGNNSSDGAVGRDDGNDDDDDEMPPGFSSPCRDEVRQTESVSTDINGEAVVIGYPQERYLAHLPIAYGLPIALMPDLTKCSSLFDPSLGIAPSMPFKQFPPLPSYPQHVPRPANTNGSSFYGNSNYHQDKLQERERFPKQGNGRRFFHPQQWNNQRPRRF